MAIVSHFADDADAQGTWQVKTWDGEVGPGMVGINVSGEFSAPDRYYDDFIRTLPADCDLGPVYENELDLALPYRCPN